MRAKRTLAVACALFGAFAFSVPADAADRQARDGRKHQGTEARSTAQRAVAKTPARSAQAPRQASAPRTATAPVPMTEAVRPVSFVVPQAAARDAMLRGVGQGTPILPVAATSGLSCVPFARMATGMNISGNGRDWWHNAAGTYARGQLPERGAILSFPGSGGMTRGHVAVVSRVVNDRMIQIDHANWGGPGIRRGTVMRGVNVIDVSDRNDWTAVRVQVGHDGSAFGRTYATHGFIYNRPVGPRTLTAEAPRAIEVAQQDASPHILRHMRLTSQMLAD